MSSPKSVAITEEIADVKEKNLDRNINHQRQASDTLVLNDNETNTRNIESVKDCKYFSHSIKNIRLIFCF